MQKKTQDKQNSESKQNGKHKEGVDDGEIVIGQQFGGPAGALGLIIFSHFIILYLWICNEYNNGSLDYPQNFSDVGGFATRFVSNIKKGAYPTKEAFIVYAVFIVSQGLFAMVLPGLKIKGLPIPSEGGKQLEYLCNAVQGWYLTLAIAFGLHCSGTFRLGWIIDHYGELLSVSMIWGDVFSIIIYATAFIFKKTNRISGNVIYDFFMGAQLNPRILNLDLKIWAEIRISWILLFFLTLGAAAKQYEELGYLTGSMWFMILAHFLYANACQKGEECIPTTWDIFYENWGFMIIFWNFAGVPFAYAFQSYYIYKHGLDIGHSSTFITVLFVILLISYYVWDTANSQKNRFRMQQRKTFVKRLAFPQLPWGTLENPKTLKSDDGKKTLLIDGWYKYARKIHYTADIVFALIWGLSCGTTHFLPYFYFFFFFGMIHHRVWRDNVKCQQKYGEMWQKYLKTVPYIYIPYIY